MAGNKLNNQRNISVLFVCMGNICRSPTAQGVFARLVEEQRLADMIAIDSAGTHAYHIGERPDERASAAALNRGIDLSTQQARRVSPDDFERFDYVLAMDNDNYGILEASCPSGFESRLHLFLEFAPDLETREVPDPYYGGGSGFERVLDMIEQASAGLLAEIRQQHGL
jgi:protein-tyrosine phosphatase